MSDSPKQADKGKEKTVAGQTQVLWEPKECRGIKENCDVLRAWGLAWESWGNEVRIAFQNLPSGGGPPTNVSPPPPPPFK
jgi:hypothetical protein